jgi:hypothetical protein
MYPYCYISGKITGLQEEQYKANFEQAAREVRALGYQPISPVDLPHIHGHTWEEYMRESLVAMLGCSHIYVQKNCYESKGAIVEVELAERLKMTIIYQP